MATTFCGVALSSSVGVDVAAKLDMTITPTAAGKWMVTMSLGGRSLFGTRKGANGDVPRNEYFTTAELAGLLFSNGVWDTELAKKLTDGIRLSGNAYGIRFLQPEEFEALMKGDFPYAKVVDQADKAVLAKLYEDRPETFSTPATKEWTAAASKIKMEYSPARCTIPKEWYKAIK